ncbi:UNVERIFIED_CONTAM: trans-AT polyketide synthase/acyltransferase/oxidoreductase domain-containing protein [Acetivibrio alkalicellulosi]
MKKNVFMFSGQGSQYYHMAKVLYSQNVVFKEWMANINHKLFQLTGINIRDKIYDEMKTMSDAFDRLLYTHPAIFMIEYALAQTLIEAGIEPNCVLGSSLGELVALTLADFVELDKMLEFIIYQAQCIESSCVTGRMLAVFDDASMYKESIMCQNCCLVSENYVGHFVVSGSHNEIKIVSDYLDTMNIRYQILSVAYPFHSPLIDNMKKYIEDFSMPVKYPSSRIRVVSCALGTEVKSVNNELFWRIARNPIRFKEAINYLESLEPHNYIDLGPGGTLSNFSKRNLNKNSKSNVYSIITPFGTEITNLEIVKNKCSNSSKNTILRGKKEMNVLAYVFPGQGSQCKGMGGDLFDEFYDLTEKADKILGYSIKELCMNDTENLLNQTSYTQPALYIVGTLSYLKKLKETGIKPDFVAGHSLGEYVALFASGVVDFETGLKLVKKRGQLMFQATGGGMAAVIGMSEEKVFEVLQQHQLDTIDVANYNSPSQIVISGHRTDIEEAKELFEAEGARYIILKVSGAFHSRYMQEAAEEFAEYLHTFVFSNMAIPVISNVTAKPYNEIAIKQNLIQQITHSVKWSDTIRYLMGKEPIDIVQIGPGNVLDGFTKAIKREAAPLIVEDEERNEKESSQDKEENRKSAAGLGDASFCLDYGLKYAYVAGGMYKGVASKELVVRMGRAGFMAFFGSGGLSYDAIEEAIQLIQGELNNGESFGMNVLYNANNPEKEEKLVNLLLQYGVNKIEAASYINITPALVRFRLYGIKRDEKGIICTKNKIIAKVSRPEVAERFLAPPPSRILEKLVSGGQITEKEANLAKRIPMADDICVEADSGGHTDQGVAYTLVPAMICLRDAMMREYGYSKKIRIGAAGGIGTPEAAAAAFILGAEFIMTGSINQCTVEAGTSDSVKEILQHINVQDMDYAPSGDMFELGAKIQVLRKGTFFPARAKKLHDLYLNHQSIEEIDGDIRKQLEKRYFNNPLETIYEEVKRHYSIQEIEKAEKNPKHKMALIFKWYYAYATKIALLGDEGDKVNYQVPCGPALGAFNQWIKGTELESWKNRHVDEIAEKIMKETREVIECRLKSILAESV